MEKQIAEIVQTIKDIDAAIIRITHNLARCERITLNLSAKIATLEARICGTSPKAP